MPFETTNEESARPGLLGGVATMARNLLGLVLCRVELAALELADVRAALLKLAVFFAAGVITTFFALACWTGLVVMLAWESLGWKILAIVALVHTCATVLIAFYARALIREGRLSLPLTMAELRNDRDALQ
ncbi:phage holin family protein [Noviherbaspirillum sedimenti]|uniref:Phage holin family protein n=1 Tax=Noviherbaspirillum sedimenti TaxID=2320865 RepID=A0A3A3GP10_9BURK|nr:phage holin family protein [Noviherbaspirillum sedimenti]RJG02700.1 phage holin family protein [Noviherbaspirillum sedimenti]